MSDNVIQFPSMGQPLSYGQVGEIELPVEQVMDAAREEVTKNLIILGQTEDDSMFFASTSKDLGKLIVLVEAFKKMLLDAI